MVNTKSEQHLSEHSKTTENLEICKKYIVQLDWISTPSL